MRYMNNILEYWEPVIGLEIHVQLDTHTKLFSSEKYDFGENPNQNVSPYTSAIPGTLPVLNRAAIRKAVMLGVAIRGRINLMSTFDRKNYFYPDLPKGYQITQKFNPLISGGLIPLGYDNSRVIQIKQIHVEEDAGKSIHRSEASLVDLNRCGVPLAEIVTEPELRTPREAKELLKQVQRIVVYLGLNSGVMAHGVLRCDANISLRKRGDFRKGNKVEVKNLNSMKMLENALEYEIIRQSEELDANNTIYDETRLWNDKLNKTELMRSKENEPDYRFFPNPDLPPLVLKEEDIPSTESLPKLAHERGQYYRYKLGLDDSTINMIVEDPDLADYFEDTISENESQQYIKQAIKWIFGSVRKETQLNKTKVSNYDIKPERMSEFINLIYEQDVPDSMARRLFERLKESPTSIEICLEEMEKSRERDTSKLDNQIKELLKAFPEEVDKYKTGKTSLIGFFVGQYIKKYPGLADPGEIKNRIEVLLK